MRNKSPTCLARSGPCHNSLRAHKPPCLTVTWLNRYPVDILRVSPPRVCQGPQASHDWIKHEGRMQSAHGLTSLQNLAMFVTIRRWPQPRLRTLDWRIAVCLRW